MLFNTTSCTRRSRNRSSITNIRCAYDFALLLIIYSFALLLLCRCLETTNQVSAWVPLPLHPHSPLQSNYRNRDGNGNVVIYSTIEDTTTTDESSTNSNLVPQNQQLKSSAISMPISLPLPSIRYTVSSMKRGWKDSQTGVWMDEDGPRNGPPQNYWRQQSDEKLYQESIQLVQDVLLLLSSSSSSVSDNDNYKDGNNNDIETKLNELVRPIEKTNSIRRPFINRLVLNDWAPIVRRGKVVATTSITKEDNNNNSSSNGIDVPYFFHIQRTAGQKLGPKTPYGTFDEHLKPEEEITIIQQQQLVDDDTTTIITKSDDDDDDDNVVVSLSGVVKVSSDNENRLVKNNNNDDDSLYMGGITYIGKYLMVMRQQQESPEQKEEDINSNIDSDFKSTAVVTEIWMRVDP